MSNKRLMKLLSDRGGNYKTRICSIATISRFSEISHAQSRQE